jgi:diacylglycerol kinase (ATP)
LERSLEILRSHGHTVTVHPTAAPGDATRIARECAEAGADLILVAGGDGTIHEVVNGIAGSHVALAPLPAGTANVLCMELGLGGRMERVAERIGALVPVRVAAGLLETGAGVRRHFLLMGGVGLDAAVVHRVNPALKKKTGKFAYWVAGLAMAGGLLAEFDVVADAHTARCGFALASRVRNYGGDLTIARHASLRSDDFEFVLFEGRLPFRYVPYLVGVLLRCAHRLPGVTVLRGRSLLMQPAGAEPVYVQLDGELAGTLPARLSIVEDAITLLMPAEYSREST